MFTRKKLFMMLLLLFITATSQTIKAHDPLVTSDGKKIDFDYYPASSPLSPTVILLADTRGDRKLFGNFPTKLNKAGFSVLTLDFRYKELISRTRSRSEAVETIMKQDLNVLADQDVKSAMDFLSKQENVDPKRICIIGTSLGSRVALKAGVSYNIKALVLVSLSGKEVFLVPASTPIQDLLNQFGDKPILFMTSEKDWGNNYKAADDNKNYLTWFKGKGELKIWPGSEHGVDIIKREEASEYLLSWLKNNM